MTASDQLLINRFAPLRDRIQKRIRNRPPNAPAVNFSQIARDMDPIIGKTPVHPSTVSRYTREPWRLREASGKNVWVFLEGVGFTTVEITAIILEYDLSLWAERVGDERPLGLVTYVLDGSASDNDNEGKTVRLPVEVLRGRHEHAVAVREVRASDLVTQEAKGVVAVGDYLVVSEFETPKPLDLVIVRQGSAQALLVWPLSEVVFALPIDQTADREPARLDPKKAVVYRTVVAHCKDRGSERGKP